MLETLQVLTLIFVAVAMALALAHALEFPGKLRLAKDEYFAVQKIYYPGFTIGGIAEPAAALMMIALLVLTPAGSTAFWLTGGALLALILMHATYWLLTHPVNNFWVQDIKLQGAGAGFFGFDPFGRARGMDPSDWTMLRDRWEYSHLVRSALGLVSLTLLAAALAAAR